MWGPPNNFWLERTLIPSISRDLDPLPLHLAERVALSWDSLKTKARTKIYPLEKIETFFFEKNLLADTG